MKKRFIGFLLMLICASQVNFAQNSKEDSLKLVLKTAKEDTNKVKSLNMLALFQARKSMMDDAKINAEAAMALAKKLAFKKGIAGAHINMGIVYDSFGQLSAALNEYSEALKIREALNDQSGVAYIRNSIGNVHNNQGNYPEALKQFLAALKIYENLDDKKGIARVHNNIGNVNNYMQNYDIAIKEYSVALKIKEASGDTKGVAGAINNIGVVYEKQKKYALALKQYEAALKIREDIGDLPGIADSRVSMGNIYSIQRSFAQAKDQYVKVVEIQEKMGDKGSLSNSYINIGMMYYRLKEYGSAALQYDKGILLAKEMGIKPDLVLAYENYSLLDSARGDYKNAFLNFKRFLNYRDSIYNELNTKKLTQSEMQYDFDKKEAATKAEQEKKDVMAQEEKRKQKIITVSVTLGLGLVIIFAFFIFRSLRITKKQKDIIEQQKDEVLQQKEVVESQKYIIEEKHKEITDSINYAERIQQSFLATKEMLDDNLGNYFIFFKPKAIVSGDFYWGAKLNNGNFLYATADSTGHGVPGAIMSLLNITSLEKAVEHYDEPAGILNATRKTIIERLKKDGSLEGGKDGMDCSLIVINKDKKQLSYAAANNPVWIVRANNLLEFAPDKMPVGKHDKDKNPFTQQSIELQAGDVIYTFTDGIPDQFGGDKGKKFMYKQFKALLLSVAHLPMHEQKITISAAFSNWKGNLEQVDDVCLIGVRV